MKFITCGTAVLLLLLAPVAVKGGSILRVTDFGADPTGARPCHAEIAKACVAAKPGDTVLFPSGTYSLAKHIWIGNKSQIGRAHV